MQRIANDFDIHKPQPRIQADLGNALEATKLEPSKV